MMSEQRAAESSSNKKGLSNVVATVFLILIAILAVLLVWKFAFPLIQKSPLEQVNCLDVYNTFSLQNACYLSENEVKLVVSRSFDNLDVNKLVISFSPNEARWQIGNEKCSDIRLESGEYGNYCSVVDTGSKRSYVINMANVEKEDSVGVSVFVGNEECAIGKINISPSC